MSAFLIGIVFIAILFLPNVALAGNTSSLTFDGSNDYVNVGNGSNLNVGNTLTITAWIRPTNMAAVDGSGAFARRAIFSTRVTNNPAGSWQFEVGTGNGGSNRLFVTSPGIWNAETASNALSTGIWQHVAYTKSSSSGPQKLYINGIEQVLVTNNLVTFIDNTDDKFIGDGRFAYRYYQGQIDDVRLYNKALTKDQIVQAMHDTYNDGVVAH